MLKRENCWHAPFPDQPRLIESNHGFNSSMIETKSQLHVVSWAHIQNVFFFSGTFFLSAVGPPKFRWFKPAKSKGKVHERNPKAEIKGESQRLRALTSLEVDWGWWGRLLVGRGVALGVAEPPRRWPVHPPATRAKKPRRRACLRGRGCLTNIPTY